ARAVASGYAVVLEVPIGFALLIVFSEMTYRLVEMRVWRKPEMVIGRPVNLPHRIT
ncbi:MAG: hypothetical protein QOJ54_2098, partial [Aliidongia sp.]|nr:hypothetical protein [Aliidongia sp.]